MYSIPNADSSDENRHDTRRSAVWLMVSRNQNIEHSWAPFVWNVWYMRQNWILFIFCKYWVMEMVGCIVLWTWIFLSDYRWDSEAACSWRIEGAWISWNLHKSDSYLIYLIAWHNCASLNFLTYHDYGCIITRQRGFLNI